MRPHMRVLHFIQYMRCTSFNTPFENFVKSFFGFLKKCFVAVSKLDANFVQDRILNAEAQRTQRDQFIIFLRTNIFLTVHGCVRRRGNRHTGFPSLIHWEGCSGDCRLCGGRSGDASSFHRTLSRIWRRSNHGF